MTVLIHTPLSQSLTGGRNASVGKLYCLYYIVINVTCYGLPGSLFYEQQCKCSEQEFLNHCYPVPVTTRSCLRLDSQESMLLLSKMHGKPYGDVIPLASTYF